jgi:predicted nucleotidyltransferase
LVTFLGCCRPGRLRLEYDSVTKKRNLVFPSKVYRNTGSGFSETYSLTGVMYSSVAWGDYDSDGDLDILLTGWSSSAYISKVYQNTGSGFSEVYTNTLAGVVSSSVAWGDYDNDGDLDILLTGYTGSSPYRVSKVYRNTGDGFSETYSLMGVSASSVAWGDYDNDGDLDILLTGYSDSGRISKIYRNDDCPRIYLPLIQE